MVHVLLKQLENFEHYFTSVRDECSCAVVWAFFGIGMKTDLFQSCGHCWVFQICWHIECSTFTASSFRTWNSSTGIPSPPLALFVVMLSKAHLTSHSRMSGSRWVITPSWLSESWRSFLYSSSVYSCHRFLLSSASVRSIPFLSFIKHIFAWSVPLVSLIFLKRSLVFPILLLSSVSLHWSLRKAFLSLLAILWNSAFRWEYLSFSPLLFASLLFTAIWKASSDSHFAFLHFFSMGVVLIPVSCTVSRTSVHSWFLSPLQWFVSFSLAVHEFISSDHSEQHFSFFETAAAAKSLQSCPMLCNPIHGSPWGSPVPGILQARTLEWVAISFSSAWKWKVKVKSLCHVRLFMSPRTAAYQAPPSMGFSRQEYWSGVPLPSPLSNRGK